MRDQLVQICEDFRRERAQALESGPRGLAGFQQLRELELQAAQRLQPLLDAIGQPAGQRLVAAVQAVAAGEGVEEMVHRALQPELPVLPGTLLFGLSAEGLERAQALLSAAGKSLDEDWEPPRMYGPTFNAKLAGQADGMPRRRKKFEAISAAEGGEEKVEEAVPPSPPVPLELKPRPRRKQFEPVLSVELPAAEEETIEEVPIAPLVLKPKKSRKKHASD